MAKNDYLRRKQAAEQKLLDIGEDIGFQKCWDFLQIALRDESVVGKGQAFGVEKMKRLYHGIDRVAHEYADAYTFSAEADYCQEKMDAALGEIWQDELTRFPERYPYIKQLGYSKGRKEWR